MSRILKLEIPDALFTAIERQAAIQGTDPATVAMCMLKDHFEAVSGAGGEQDGVAAFRAMFGAADLGHPTGLDNEKIDADLAKDYARGLQ